MPRTAETNESRNIDCLLMWSVWTADAGVDWAEKPNMDEIRLGP
jgi:hypothetical protein